MRKRLYEGEREQRGESQEPASPVRVQEGHPLPVPGEERPFERRLRMEVTFETFNLWRHFRHCLDQIRFAIQTLTTIRAGTGSNFWALICFRFALVS